MKAKLIFFAAAAALVLVAAASAARLDVIRGTDGPAGHLSAPRRPTAVTSARTGVRPLARP